MNFAYLIIREAFLFGIVLASLYFISPLMIYNNKHFFPATAGLRSLSYQTIYLPHHIFNPCVFDFLSPVTVFYLESSQAPFANHS